MLKMRMPRLDRRRFRLVNSASRCVLAAASVLSVYLAHPALAQTTACATANPPAPVPATNVDFGNDQSIQVAFTAARAAEGCLSGQGGHHLLRGRRSRQSGVAGAQVRARLSARAGV